MFSQLWLLSISLVLIGAALWSVGQLIWAIRVRGIYPAGMSRLPERAGWWTRGALCVIATSVGGYTSMRLVDPYTWHLFFVGVAMVVWVTTSAIFTIGTWREFHDRPTWAKLMLTIAIFAIVGGVCALPFGGGRVMGGLWLIGFGIFLFVPIVQHWLEWCQRSYWNVGNVRGLAVPAAVGFIGLWLVHLAVYNVGYMVYRELAASQSARTIVRAVGPPPSKPTPRLRARLPKQILGKGIWIFCLDACVRREKEGLVGLVKRAKWAGVDHILVKTFDARLHLKYPKSGDWMPWNEDGEDVRPYVRQLVKLAHAENIRVYAWGFVWGERPTHEAELAIESLRLGVDGLFYDVEDGFVGGAVTANELCSVVDNFVRKKPWLLVGFTSYDNPFWHPNVPYVIFDKYCEVFGPQSYWKDDEDGKPTERLNWGADKWVRYLEEVLKPAGGGKSFDWIVPVGHGYDPRIAPNLNLQEIPYVEILRFMQDTQGFWSVQLWVGDYMGPAQWQAIRDGPGGLEEKAERWEKLLAERKSVGSKKK